MVPAKRIGRFFVAVVVIHKNSVDGGLFVNELYPTVQQCCRRHESGCLLLWRDRNRGISYNYWYWISSIP